MIDVTSTPDEQFSCEEQRVKVTVESVAIDNPLKTGMRDGHLGTKKPETKPVRLHVDVAELAERLAGAFGKSTPDYLSELLRPMLEQERARAAESLMGEPKKRRHKPD